MATKPKRQTRKERLKTTDQFQTTASSILDWARANPKIIVTAAVVFVLFLAGVVWFVNYRATRRANIRTMYANASIPLDYPQGYVRQFRMRAILYGGYQLSATMPFGLGHQALTEIIADAPRLAAQDVYQALLRYQPGSTLAGLALLRLAALARNEDRPLRAVRLIRRFLARDDVPAILKPPARLALGQALEEAGRPDEAVKVFGAITTPGYRDLGQFNRTRVLADRARAKGDLAEARRLWQRFLSQFPKSPRGVAAERILESLPGRRPVSGS